MQISDGRNPQTNICRFAGNLSTDSVVAGALQRGGGRYKVQGDPHWVRFDHADTLGGVDNSGAALAKLPASQSSMSGSMRSAVDTCAGARKKLIQVDRDDSSDLCVSWSELPNIS